MPGVQELNIGFAIVARALLVGVEQAVQEMLRLLTSAPTTSAVAEALPGARS
jgi:pyridoxine 5-phosphate synthase